MKKIISIGYVGLLVCTLGFTSCVDEHDTPVNVFGNILNHLKNTHLNIL